MAGRNGCRGSPSRPTAGPSPPPAATTTLVFWDRESIGEAGADRRRR